MTGCTCAGARIIGGACLSSTFDVVPIKLLLEQATQLVVTLLEMARQKRRHVWMHRTLLIISLHPYNDLNIDAVMLSSNNTSLLSRLVGVVTLLNTVLS